ILTDAMEGSDGAIREARRLHALDPDVFYPDQYNNEANWRAHYDTTALEVWEQTNGRVPPFVAGLGTSGTFTGAARRLRELNARIRVASVQPDGPLHGIEGLKHMASSIVPGIYDAGLADEDLRVSTEDAYDMTRRLAAREGLLVGFSSGAAAVAARRVGGELIGFYHSHPDHPAEPSQYDLDHAWPNLSYVIVAVRGGQAADLRSWRLRADRSAFDEENLGT